MGYELIDIADIEALPDRTASGYEVSDHYLPMKEDEPRPPTRGPTNVGFRVYFVEPGEALGTRGMHYHEEQEELFYVIEGTLHVETPERTYEVRPGQALLVEPGSPQRAFNPDDAEESVYLVAVGAPSYRSLGRNDGVGYDPRSE